MSKNNLPEWLPQLNVQIWILALGRLLSQTGTGFTLFYTPIFFVNQVGLSATAVGLALGSAQISGIFGRFLGGSLCDSEFWGRRGTLLLSAVISAIASLVIGAASDFPSLVLGKLLIGLGYGLYWPAVEAAVADLTQEGDRSEAYALTRLGDSIGLQLGIVLAGLFISTTGAYRSLFAINCLFFLAFFGVVYFALVESYNKQGNKKEELENQNGWLVAFSDRNFLIFVAVNILFTFYFSQVHSTLTLYLTNFVPGNFSPGIISALFTWHISLSVVFQLPVTKLLNRFSRPNALSISALLWGVGFVLIDLTGWLETGNLLLAILSLGFLAIAGIIYGPAESALIADLSPENLRGIYSSINSQSWAIGFLIGPPLGGFALDSSAAVINIFWLGIALSVGIAIIILQYLDKAFEV